MTFERTTNWALIKSIVTHPKIYPHVSDDSSPQAEQWEPARHESIWYVIVRDDDELLGMWMIATHNAVLGEIHTCLLPNAWGEKARKAAKELGAWVWENTPFLRITTEVPEYNRLAMRFAKLAGMAEFGRNPKSFLRHGKLWDVVLLGISKPGMN